MFSGFMCCVACVRISFLLKDDRLLIVCICHILFIRSSISGHLGCFHLLAIMSNAAINMSAQMAGSYGNSTYVTFCYKGNTSQREEMTSPTRKWQNKNLTYFNGASLTHFVSNLLKDKLRQMKNG